MTYPYRARGGTKRCAILTEAGDLIIQVEGHPCTQTLAPSVFYRRWVQDTALGACSCGAQAIEWVGNVALCGECAGIERRNG